MSQLKTLTFILSGVLLLAGSCCEDCPTCPDESDETPQHYKMYAGAWDNDAGRTMLLSIDIPADTIIDSVTLTAEQHKLAADAASIFYSLFTLMPDGRWLIAGDGGGGYSIGAPTFLIFDIKNMAIKDYVEPPDVHGIYYTCQNSP